MRAMTAIVLAFAIWTAAGGAATDDALRALVAKERPAVIDTLRQLVNIESGSRDKPGLDRMSAVLADRLRALGARVEFYEPTAAETYRMFDTPPQIGRVVIGRFTGTGTRKIMVQAHMDTVYQSGVLATRPFRIEGNRAYGPGIADDKGGIANILHALAILKTMNMRDYAALTVLINADEELSTPGARAVIQRVAAEHDLVLSCEPPLSDNDSVTLA